MDIAEQKEWLRCLLDDIQLHLLQDLKIEYSPSTKAKEEAFAILERGYENLNLMIQVWR
jgi:hypothetical protein